QIREPPSFPTRRSSDLTSSDSDFDVNVTGVAGGDWTVKGSESYNTAKTIFDFMTKKVGMSGAGAAGVVGNALVESGFNPKASNGDRKSTRLNSSHVSIS